MLGTGATPLRLEGMAVFMKLSVATSCSLFPRETSYDFIQFGSPYEWRLVVLAMEALNLICIMELFAFSFRGMRF